MVAGVQARMGSRRLPGKMLADVAGEPLVVRVVERVRAAALVDEVVVLTSDAASDDALVAALESRDIEVRRGPEHDVLARYIALADEYEPRFLVRVTGDCPLLEPAVVDLQLRALRAFDADFARIDPEGRGGLEGTLAGQGALSARALRRAAASDDARDREHVGSFHFRRHAAAFRFVDAPLDEGYRRPGLRLCVDEAADLALVRRVFEHFEGRPFTTLEVIRWLDGRPEVAGLNREVVESRDNRDCRRLEERSPVVPVGRFP